jgi:hypothetical protein
VRREEAEAAATKREAHKPRHLIAKRWQACYVDGVKGWQPRLVDCPFHLEREAEKKRDEARRLLQLGDARFFDVAGEALLARCKAAIAYAFDTPTPAPDASPSASSAPAAVAVPSTSALATDGADRGDAG